MYDNLTIVNETRRIKFYPTCGLFSSDSGWEEDLGEVSLHYVDKNKNNGNRPQSGIGIDFRPDFAFTFNTYLRQQDAKALGEALAQMTGCAWYDPEEDE